MNFDDYQMTIPYPTPVRHYVCDCKTVIHDLEQHYCHACGKHVAKEIQGLKQLFKLKREEYREELKKVSERFKKDILKEFGLTDHLNADNIYAYACYVSHLDGYYSNLSLSDVYDALNDMQHYKLF